MTVAFYLVILLAIIVMLFSLALVLRLKRITSGGRVGRVVNVLLGFILLFTIGYLTGPFLPALSHEFGLMVMAVVFLFGALFVCLVLWLIKTLIGQVFEELKLK